MRPLPKFCTNCVFVAEIGDAKFDWKFVIALLRTRCLEYLSNGNFSPKMCALHLKSLWNVEIDLQTFRSFENLWSSEDQFWELYPVLIFTPRLLHINVWFLASLEPRPIGICFWRLHALMMSGFVLQLTVSLGFPTRMTIPLCSSQNEIFLSSIIVSTELLALSAKLIIG